MCLGISGKVLETYRENDVLMGKVDFSGIRKGVCLEHVPQARPGDYVLVHVGFALSVLDEDKPLKYPTIFNTADVAILTKMDLGAAVEFDAAAAHRSIQAVRPGMEIFEVSVKTGEGMERWLNFLQQKRVRSDNEPEA